MRVSKKYAMYHFFNLRINTIIKYYLIEIAKELRFSYVQYSQVFLVIFKIIHNMIMIVMT